MRGTSNTAAGKVAGDTFGPDTANDLIKIAVGADDDSLAELLGFEPPAAVTPLTPRVGFLPLRNGPVVTGDGAARNVNVAPVRALRSSIDNTKPREALSAVTTTTTTVAMPAAVGAGLWRLELLYAQISYVDASRPEMGTVCTPAFAPTAAGAAVAGAPTVAVLPANTAATWNVPIAYVKNVGGAATIANEDILPAPASVVGGFAQDLQARLVAQKTGIDARRAYSSANNDPTKLVTGGTSAYAAGSQILTSVVTGMMVGRPGGEIVTRTIYIPKERTGPNAFAWDRPVVDDTRDWRGANFFTQWIVNAGNTINHGEDDASTANRIMPAMLGTSGTGVYVSTGQSWAAYDPANGGAFPGGAALWASVIGSDVSCPPVNIGGVSFAGDVVALEVDAATGALMFTRKRVGAAANGPAITIYLVADFGNHLA
jgi:hypothetical protein